MKFIKPTDQRLLEEGYESVYNKSRNVVGRDVVSLIVEARECARGGRDFPWTVEKLTKIIGSREKALEVRRAYLDECGVIF